VAHKSLPTHLGRKGSFSQTRSKARLGFLLTQSFFLGIYESVYPFNPLTLLLGGTNGASHQNRPISLLTGHIRSVGLTKYIPEPEVIRESQKHPILDNGWHQGDADTEAPPEMCKGDVKVITYPGAQHTIHKPQPVRERRFDGS
jgi:hypothetical protein